MRRCGDCQLCCKLVPVNEGFTTSTGENIKTFVKPAGQRCLHQKAGVGCRVHGTDAMPMSCKLWSCRWLMGEDTQDLQRPDRTHYVIDPMPDFVTQEGRAMEVVQVWVDPAYPDAHRDPALRRWIERRNKPALIRYSERVGMLVAPPACNEDNEWLEIPTQDTGEEQHSMNQLAETLGGHLEMAEDPTTGMNAMTLVTPDGRRITMAARNRVEE